MSSPQRVVGIVLDQAFDDWLSALNVSLDAFVNHMRGSWVFNYVDALQRVGVKPVLFCVSSGVSTITRLSHAPTGASIVLLPPTKLFRMIRRVCPWLFSPAHAGKVDTAAVTTGERLRRNLAWLVKSYLSTPVMRLFKVIRQEGCAALLVQEYESVCFDFCVLAGTVTNLPVFGTFTGAFPQDALVRPLRRIALKLCRGLLICAQSEMDRVQSTYHVPTDKLTLVHYPLDFSVWHPGEKAEARAMLGIPTAARVLMYHGEALLWVKGLDVLLNAWEHLCNETPNHDLRLVLVGTGADATLLRQALHSKALRGVYWVNEWIHDRHLIQRYLSAADVYVFPSRIDAFGISVIEAMACGLPVVASSVRGTVDTLSDPEQCGGILIPPGDMDALGRAIKRLLTDPELAQEFGKRARSHVRARFSMEQIGNCLNGVLLQGHA